MVWKKNIKKYHLFFSFFTFFIFSAFLLFPHLAHAVGVDLGIKAGLELAFKGLLYAVFTFFGWLATVAITLFSWAIEPSYISGASGLLNNPAIYDLWKFVRDFFNLFFILVLLYIAFTVVFQIQKNFKQALLSLVLAALFVNFSFPISRFLIDVTNVPMYFFANQMGAGDSKGGALGAALSASQLKRILIPGSESGGDVNFDEVTVSRFIAAIVFIFIFSITLLVLAIMFIIRLVALVILVIFSSVGFAAAIIPGLESYSKMWWDSFWKYTIFGPAAMFMLLASMHFFAAIANANTFKGIKNVAGNVATEPTFIASMAMFSIPIIMLWMSISLASKFSIAGAGSISGKGEKFAKWAGRKMTYDNALGHGLAGAGKKIAHDGKILGMNYGGTRLGKFATGAYWSSPSKTEATIKGGIVGGWGGGAKERAKLHPKEVNARVKEDKENQVSLTTHRKNLMSSKDDVEREAAALALAGEKEIRTAEELSTAMEVLSNNGDGLLKVLDNAKSQAIGKLSQGSHKKIQESFYEKDGKNGIKLGADGKPVIREGMQAVHEAYTGKLKKEGNIKLKVDYELAQKGIANTDTSENAQAVYKSNFDDMQSEDIAKQEGVYKDPGFKVYVQERAELNPEWSQTVMKKVMEKSGGEAQNAWLEMISGVNTKKTGPAIVVANGYRTRTP